MAAVAGTIIAAALATSGAVYGSNKSSSANNRALKVQQDAARYAADVETRRTNAERERRDEDDRLAAERWNAEQDQAAKDRQYLIDRDARQQKIEDEDRAYMLSERERIAAERAAQEAARNSYVPEAYVAGPPDPRRTLRDTAAANVGGLLGIATPGYRPATAPILPPAAGLTLNQLLYPKR